MVSIETVTLGICDHLQVRLREEGREGGRKGEEEREREGGREGGRERGREGGRDVDVLSYLQVHTCTVNY